MGRQAWPAQSGLGDRTLTRPAEVPAGLSSEQAAEALATGGPNVLPAPRPVPLWRRTAAQIRDPLVLVLLAAAILTIATGDWTDAAVITLVIVVNTAVGVAQEVRASREITALSQITAPEARVMRDGRQRQIPAAEVVTGDLLVLAEGDIVPADAHVVASAALRVDESALTGESAPVDKTAGDGDDGQVSAGTIVVHGRGRAMVTATGPASAMGRIAALMQDRTGLTPLQRRMARLGRDLAVAAVVLCLAVMTIGLVRGQPVELMVITAISLVVAAVPESLPAVVTLALALGARRMTARNALVRRLPAVETLGSVTVVCTDKTGTLTEGSMVARRLWTPAGTTVISGGGYAPDGEVSRGGRPLTPDGAPDVAELLTAAALCNDAALRPPADDRPWSAVGDPTEAALLSAAMKLGLDPHRLAAELPRTSEVPFDSDRKRMTTVHRLPDGRAKVISKGAPEVMLTTDTLAERQADVAAARSAAEQLAGDGFRVLAVAIAERPAPPEGPGSLEDGMHLLGLIGINDPARESAPRTIRSFQAAGITPVLITGDHPATARALASELGIVEPGELVVDCRAAEGDEFTVARAFARATPSQKLEIIKARQHAGDVVAMTGDGVNDGPALRRADIGVAMGKRGTEVARQAADLVLADDNLATVAAAAEEGRRVYDNIRRFLLYGMSGGGAEIAVMLAGPLVGLALPLLPAQILWVNLLTHGLPGVALGSEPADPGIMDRPPRPPSQSIIGAGLWQRIVAVGLVVAGVTLSMALWGHATGRPWQSMAFLALGATQLAGALGSRARPGTRANLLLPVAVAGALALQLAGLYVPVLRDLLHTRPLGIADLLIVLAASSLGYVAMRVSRAIPEGKGRARS